MTRPCSTRPEGARTALFPPAGSRSRQTKCTFPCLARFASIHQQPYRADLRRMPAWRELVQAGLPCSAGRGLTERREDVLGRVPADGARIGGGSLICDAVGRFG